MSKTNNIQRIASARMSGSTAVISYADGNIVVADFNTPAGRSALAGVCQKAGIQKLLSITDLAPATA